MSYIRVKHSDEEDNDHEGNYGFKSDSCNSCHGESNRLWKVLSWTFLCLLVAQAIAINMLTFVPWQKAFSESSSSRPHTHTASAAASFSTRLGWDARYMSISHEYDDLWNTSLSSSRILTGDSSEANKDDSALIGMFHQLQCLASFRVALQRAGHGLDIGMDWHKTDEDWPRCLDYLRQIILCHADATIEREDLGESLGDGESEVLSSMTWRNCKSTSALHDLRAAHGVHVE